jgi:hypothetical protein
MAVHESSERRMQDKLSQVTKWIQNEHPENVCMIVLKSNNDTAIVYQLHEGQLVPSYVENSACRPCSMMDSAVLAADLKDDVIQFRVSLTDRVLYLSKDQEGRPAVVTQDTDDGDWVRLDILYIDLDRPAHAKVHGYGKRVSTGKPWTTWMGMDLSRWF